MGFEVRVRFPFDDDWAERDERLRELAGRSHFSGAGVSGWRDHGYIVSDFDAATALKNRIKAAFPEWEATIREE